MPTRQPTQSDTTRCGDIDRPVALHALPARSVGAELRLLRERAGLSQRQLAELVGCSDSLLGLVENAARPMSERLAAQCDLVFGTGGSLSRLAQLARHFGGVAEPVETLLRQAAELWLAEPLHVPELARTDAYAHALTAASLMPAGQCEARLAARPRLAALLDQTPSLRAWLVIEETVLYRPIGSRETLRRQLQHLLDLVDTGRVIIQVLPTTDATTALLRLPQVLLAFPDGNRLAHIPNLTLDDTAERYADTAVHTRAFDLLRAAAHAPGPSRGLIATATR